MGFKILGAPEETVLLSLQGDVTLSLTPDSGLTFNSFTEVSDPPRLSDFDNYIDTYGPDHASTFDQDWQNYDGDRVHRFLADYTGDTGTYMPTSAAIRDEYWNYIIGSYNPATWLIYPNGLYFWAQDTGFPSGAGVGGVSSVAQAFAEIADNKNFTHQDHANHYGQVYSREVAYCLFMMVRGEQLVGASQFNSMLGYSGNYPLDLRYQILLSKAENHMRQWRNNDFTNPDNSEYMTAFMVGITCYCLAQYYEQRGNEHWPGDVWPDIPTAVEDVLTWLYDEAPNHATGGNYLQTNFDGAGTYDSFPYVDRTGSPEGDGAFDASPELNMIIAPAYAWLGKHYSDSSYITNYADRLFGGMAYHLSTSGASWWATNTTKQYNQLFYWAQEYFTWRQQV